MLTARIVRMELVKGESLTVYHESDIDDWLGQGYIEVRKPRFIGDNYVLHRPTEILVTWEYQGRTITDNKRNAIIAAYTKKGKKIQRITDAAFRRMKEDLEAGRLVAKFSKYRPGDIFFIVT